MNIQKFTTLKTILIALVFTISANQLFSQTTNGIFFQAVARDNFSNPAKDRKIYVQSSIIQTTPTGTKVLTEEHQANTDATGVFSISLGNGVRVGGTASSLTTIDWSKGPYYLNLKVAITPIGGNSNWDYTKEWVDMGTTSFGAVPFALYSASSAKVDDKLNVSDTTTMLKVYAKAMSVQTLETAVASKLTAADTLTMLKPYAKAAYTIDSSFFKAQLATKLSIADSTKYVTVSQLASYNFSSGGGGSTIDTSSLSNRINLKANASDITTLNTNVASNTSSITANATAITAEATRATAAELVLTSNVSSNTSSITANAADIATLNTNVASSTASITANIADIATLNTNVASNTISITSNIDAINLKAPIASPTFTGTLTAPIYATTPQALTAGSTITWDPSLGLNASVTLNQNSTLIFSTRPPSGSYGTLVITQDATGGRTITLPNTSNKVLGSTSTTSIELSTAAGAKDIINFYFDGTNCYWNIGQGYGSAATASSTNLASGVTGTLAVANGGTGATTLTGLIKGNGTSAMTAATAGTDYLAPNGSAASLTNFPTFNQNTTGTAANVTGTVAVANGGTGATTLTGIVKGAGTSALTTAIAGTDYQAPITLTTTGSGASTLSGTTLNIPTGVPYSGATGAVNLGAYNLTVSSFTIGQGKTPASGDNLAIGRSALNNTTSNGWPNIGLGSNSLNQTTDGKNNVGVGFNALYANTTGSYNIGIGTEAARNASTSSNITAIGMEALKYESGAGNTAVGSYAGKPSTSAVYSGTTNSTFIGYNTTTGKTSDATITNSTAIGYGAAVTASHTIQLGNTSVTDVKTSGALTTGAVTYPNAHGAANQVLTTTGSGTLTWTTPASSGGDTYTIGLNNNLGGYVVYVTPDGKHGLVAETVDQVRNTQTTASGFASREIFRLSYLATDPRNHSTAGKNFMDWRIPNYWEMQQVILYKTQIGGFDATNWPNYFLSISINRNETDWVVGIDGGDFTGQASNGSRVAVRTVRSF